MEINISKTFEYIPEWNGNKEDENPIVAHCRYLTNEQLDKCLKVGSEIKIDRRQYLKEGLEKLENCKLNGKQIVGPEDLLKAQGLGGLYSEIVTKIMEVNNLEPPKN